MLKTVVAGFACFLAQGMGRMSRHRRSFILEPSDSTPYVQFETVKDSRGNRDSGERSSDLTVLEFRRFGHRGESRGARSSSRDTHTDSDTGADDTESNSDEEDTSLSESSDLSEDERRKRRRAGPKEQKAQRLTEPSHEPPRKRGRADRPQDHQNRRRQQGKKTQRRRKDSGDDAADPSSAKAPRNRKEEPSDSDDKSREKRKNARAAGGKGDVAPGKAKKQSQNKSELITDETPHKAPDTKP